MAQVSEDQIINDLNRCLTQLHGSVAEYLLESDPYLTDNDKEAMGALGEIAAADAKFAREAGELIETLDGIPQMGSFDPALASFNYLSFPKLLDIMIEHKAKLVAMYQALVETVPNYPEIRSFYQRVLEANESQLERLKGIRKNRYKSDEPEEEEAAPAAESGEESSAEESGAEEGGAEEEENSGEVDEEAEAEEAQAS